MKRNIFAILLSASVLLLSFNLGPNHKLNEDDLEHMYRCFFNNPYEYMFSDGGKIEMNGAYYGVFRAGINGILFYGGLERCMGDISVDKGWDDTDKDVYEMISGIPATTGKMHGFDAINPEIVKWGYENMIPNPKGDLDGFTYQEVYDGVFQRYFRLMTQTYLYVHNYTDVEKEKAEYIAAYSVEKYGVDDHLRERYTYIPMLMQIDYEPDGTAWTVPMGIGFWIRRAMDGSDKEIFKGLEMLMKQYDGKWYEKITKEMDGRAVVYDKAEACGSCDCEVTVYVQNVDGIPVYVKPDKGSDVLRNVRANKPGSRNDCDTEYSFLTITGYKDGWYKISSVEGCDNCAFKNGGWINGVQLLSSVRGYGGRGAAAYTKASKDSEIFNMFQGEVEVELLGCEGEWILINAMDKEGESITGWLEPWQQCPNPYTTCP